ncbi:MAG: arsenate reductase ArsC [Myxococcota bacterium]
MQNGSDIRVWNVLFLCTGNSARSLLAEAALARIGVPRFRAWSAGSQPKSAPHPLTLETLEALGYGTANLRSKSWDEFSQADAPQLDLIFTVCGNAAEEACPVWPGHPMTVHWGVEDPAAATGSKSDVLAFFRSIHDQLLGKVEALVELDRDGSGASGALDRLSADALRAHLEAIGR